MKQVLSIDGGGIKGVFPAAFLANFEKDLGKSVADYFDLIVGTSTGGIIALALGLGVPAADILAMYEQHGPQIFQRKRGSSFRSLLSARYGSEALEEALNSIFHDRQLGESKTRLMIPSVDLETGQVHVFKTAHHQRFVRDYKERVTAVALATSAAPTFFPIHRLDSGVPLIDGGVWANNPMGAAAVEAIGLLGWQQGDVRLLSIGCTDAALNVGAARKRFQGLNYWARRGVRVFMAAQSSSSIGTAQLLLGHSNVVRISPDVNSSRFSLGDARDIQALTGLGYSESRNQFPQLESVFFQTKAAPFSPFRSVTQPPGAQA